MWLLVIVLNTGIFSTLQAPTTLAECQDEAAMYNSMMECSTDPAYGANGDACRPVFNAAYCIAVDEGN